MPSDFDPYYYFLGIPPKERPLDHYLLLGVERFESSEQIIEMAADRQMGHLQRYESGEHGEKVSQLMSEVSRARLCLLGNNKKTEYDQQLRAKLEPSKPVPQPIQAKTPPKMPPPLPRRSVGPNPPVAPLRKSAIPVTGPSLPQPRSLPNPIQPAAATSKPAPPLVRARRLSEAPSRDVVVNSIGMPFVAIPAGQFMMGSPANEQERGHNEFMHPVAIGPPFCLGIYPVTQAQYQQVVGVNPSSFSPTGLARSEVLGIDTSNFPVEWVSWTDAAEFCRRLSVLPDEHAAGRIYRLPTEAEWEYACRASTSTPFAFGDSLTSNQANFVGAMPYGTNLRGPNLQRPSVVGSYPPNAWGLHDMHGNVWEWCHDIFCPRHDRQHSVSNKRVIRGGAWKAGARACRSASRMGENPDQRTDQIGFRVALQVQ